MTSQATGNPHFAQCVPRAQGAAFDGWAAATVWSLVGLRAKQGSALIDWGEDTGKPVLVPKACTGRYAKPRLGLIDDLPWVLMSSHEQPFVEHSGGRLVFGFDLITATGWLLGGYEEYLANQRDRFGRWDEANSLVLASGLATRPAVNIWVNRIRDFLEARGVELAALWPDGKRFAVALTHDVDNPRYFGWRQLRRLIRSLCRRDRGAARSALMKLGAMTIIASRDRFTGPKGFARLLAAEGSFGFRSTILLSGLPSGSPYADANDPAYDIEDSFLQPSIRLAREGGYEMALHPSLATAPHVGRYREQKERVEHAARCSLLSARHHYWNVTRQDTGAALDAMGEAGLEFDSSLSFYSAPGFRRSIAWPFIPFHPLANRSVSVVELPPTLMDRWAGKQGAHEVLDDHLGMVQRHRGLAVLNWHVNRFSNRHYAAEGRVYLEALAALAAREDVWVARLCDVGEWWRQRTECAGGRQCT